MSSHKAQARRWLRLIAGAHEARLDIWHRGGTTIHRIAGGSNNALYRIEEGGTAYACKLCVADGRHRAAQEYGTLRLLGRAGLDLAPEPLLLDESRAIVPFPAVVYRWLPGEPLQPPLSKRQQELFLASIQHLHALRPGRWDVALRDSWYHQFDFDWYLTELEDFLQAYGPWLATTRTDGGELRERLAQLVARCHAVVAATDVNPSRERVAVCLCRLDPNLANTVWGPDERLRWVDWEYSGWGDPALDLVELRWHAALEGLGAAAHRWLRENYRRPADDPAFEARLAVWDRITVTRWCFLTLRWLWSQHNGPDRLRLSSLEADSARIRAQLVRFIQRAEEVFSLGWFDHRHTAQRVDL